MGRQNSVQVEACLPVKEVLVCWFLRKIILVGFLGRISCGKVLKSFPNFHCGSNGLGSCFLEVLSYSFFQFLQVLYGLEVLSYFFFHPC